MISSGLSKFFTLCWGIIKLNLYFLLMSLCGGLIFGVGPAFLMMADFLGNYPLDGQKLTFSFAFDRWKQNFVRGNILFYLFIAILALLAYNLFLSVQIEGLLWIMIDFILFFLLLLVTMLYLYGVIYHGIYVIRLIDLLKLSFISVFIDFGSFLKMIAGLAGIVLLTWKMKALLLFGSFSLVVVIVNSISVKTRTFIDGKMTDEA